MKHRNIMAVILFSIITLGIYDLFWLASVKKELNAKTNVHIPTLWLLFAPVAVFVVAIVAAVAIGASSGGSQTAAAGAGILIIVLDILGFVAIVPITFYWFFKFSKAVNHYTNAELSTAITFILLWILRFIGMAIIQDKFNDMLAGGTTTQAPDWTPPAPAVDNGLPQGQYSQPVNPGFAAPQSGASGAPAQPAFPQPTVPSEPTTPTSFEPAAPSQPLGQNPVQPAYPPQAAPVSPVEPPSNPPASPIG